MRFLVDAQLPPGLVQFLEQRGHEAKAVRDVGLREAQDPAMMAPIIRGLLQNGHSEFGLNWRRATESATLWHEQGQPRLWWKSFREARTTLAGTHQCEDNQRSGYYHVWPSIERPLSRLNQVHIFENGCGFHTYDRFFIDSHCINVNYHLTNSLDHALLVFCY
jgi:hypothetical protein